MNERLPAVTNGNDFDALQRVAMALYKSQYFTDVKSVTQAIVKVMAGAELGLPPFASMTGIHIIKGKPVLGANVIATLVKGDARYDYQITVCNDRECFIEWRENGQVVGASSFTIEEAQGAGLASKDVWKKYPSDLLFARAISRGAKRFAPGIFGGSPVYTPDEMGLEVDPDGYVDVVDVEPTHEMGSDNTDIYPVGPEPVAEEPPEPVKAEPSDNGQTNGKPEPKFKGDVAGARAWLAEKGEVVLGIIADAAVMTALYDDREHVRSTLELDEPDMVKLQSQGLGTDFRRKVTNTLLVFDLLMARKATKAENAGA